MKATTSSDGQRATALEAWENLVTEHAASEQSVEAFCRNRRVAEVQKLEAELAKAEQANAAVSDDSSGSSKKKRMAKSDGSESTGRRNLAEVDLRLVLIEIRDETIEKTAERI